MRCLGKLTLGMLFLFCGAARAQNNYTSFETVAVAPGIYAYISRECTPAGVVSGNVTAIIGEHAVLVVDSGHFPSATRKIIAHLKSVTDKPVRYLVNTHWHQDHIMGNAEFAAAYPGVVILTHPFTAKELAKPENGSAYSKFMTDNLPAAIDALKGAVASGKRRDGSALTEAERERVRERIAAYEASLPEARLMRFEPPQAMLDGAAEISLGGITARVLWPGIGNTEGDLIVLVLEARVLVTGDLIVYPTPFATNSQLLPWSDTLDKLAAFGAVRIVPGHGPVMNTTEYLLELRDLLRSVARQLDAAKKDGLSKEQALARIEVQPFGGKYLTTPSREGAFRQWFLNFIVENAYKVPAAEGK